MIISAVAVACNDWLARHRWHLGRGLAFSVLLVEIVPLEPKTRPVVLGSAATYSGFHPIASFEAHLVGLAGGGRVALSVGAAPVLGKALESAIKVFRREL
jgi:hypothetical protein